MLSTTEITVLIRVTQTESDIVFKSVFIQPRRAMIPTTSAMKMLASAYTKETGFTKP